MPTGGVVPNMIGHPDRRLAAGHPAVLDELALVAAEGEGDAVVGERAFRMITYRLPEVYCSQGQNLPSLAKKRPYNPLLVHPEVMSERGWRDGDLLRVENRHGAVDAVAHASTEVGRDTVALAFGWGDPDDPRPAREKGSNVQALTSADDGYDPVTGLAIQSAIEVRLRPAEA